MAYDPELANRLRSALSHEPEVTEQKMFGGLSFLVRGNMCCGVVGSDAVFRVGPDRYAAALAEPHVREMNFTGRPFKGFVYVGSAGIATDEDLRVWVGRAAQYARSLPPK